MIGLRIKSLPSKYKHLFSLAPNIFQHDRLSMAPFLSQIQTINCFIAPPFPETIKEIKARALQFIKPLNSSSYSERGGHENQYTFTCVSILTYCKN